MTRSRMLTVDSDSSDSEREDDGRVRAKQHGYRARRSTKSLVQQTKRSPSDSRRWTSEHLAWNVLETEDSEHVLSYGTDMDVETSLTARSSKGRSRSRPERELPLSHPESWVWKRKKHAKLAVAIDSTNSAVKSASTSQEPSSKVVLSAGTICRTRQKADTKKVNTKNGNTKVWLNMAKSSANLRQRANMGLAVSLKQTSMDRFLGSKTTPASYQKKSSASILTNNNFAWSRESISLSATEDDEISSNKCPRGNAKSNKSTPLTSASNTPEPATNKHGRVRSVRNAKRKVLASVVTSDVEVGTSSASDFIASENPSDDLIETPSATDREEIEDSSFEDEDDVILLVAKRIKVNTKKSKASSVDFEELPNGDDLEDDINEIKAKKTEKKKTAKDYEIQDTFTYKIGVNENLKPICKINDIYTDIVDNARKLGFDDVISHLQGRKLKIATMCSGTESPLLAMQLVSKILKKHGKIFEYEHLFSAEIVPFKQAYIERNFSPSILYRDIKELSIPGATHATTAYGGRAAIPDGVDLLVAGFSCVDFSRLNNKRKTIEEGGESGDTLWAIKDYAEKYRPKIMILENIDGAPWVAIRDEVMPQIGYAAEFAKVDTKAYYIPQTRCRRYMICVDTRKHHDPSGKNHRSRDPKIITSIISNWQNTLESFKRPASCPVEAFMLDEDDPRAIQGRAELANSGRGEQARTKEVDWARCHGRHQDYRVGLCLGQKRPLTNWEDGGSCKPSEYMWQDWMRGQVERVWDTIEISWLRNLTRGFDHQYKSRILELSQNVDRVKDNIGAGLAGCITPTGMPFSTIRGGPLIGLEALSLQGLPIDELQLTRERQSQLQDLAGNAMSSTVVGPAILAALIAGYRTLVPGSDDAMETELSPLVSKLYGEEELIPFQVDLADYRRVSVATVLETAAKTARLCICEGRTMVTTAPLQQCSLCKHAACAKCAGNPPHKYVYMKHELLSQRMAPASFDDFIRKVMPMKVLFSAAPETILEKLKQYYRDDIDSPIWHDTVGAMSRALSSELHFRCTKRSELWTIYYGSDYATMELVLASNMAEWRLYAKPSAVEPANSHIRKLLSKPIARMQPHRADIMNGTWQFWLPKVHQFDAKIQGCGALTRSFENVQGIGKYTETEVWEEYLISIPSEASRLLDVDISGKYKLLQGCGTALGSLHIQTNVAGSSAPLFLFLDPDHIQNPADDNFVFSSDKRRLNYGENRSVVARVNASWRPQRLERLGDSYAENEAKYVVNRGDEQITLAEARLPESLPCHVDGLWVDLPDLAFNTSRAQITKFHRADHNLSIRLDKNSCQSAHVVFSCNASLPESEHCAWQSDEWVEIPLTARKEFFTTFAWLTQKASTLPGLEQWRDVSSLSFRPCQLCTPDAPSIKWRLEASKQTYKTNETTKPKMRTQQKLPSKLVAFEDPEEAAICERRLKHRPTPLVTQVHIDNWGLIKLRIAVNPQTLMHRALAKLLLSQDSTRISLSWRVCTGENSQLGALLPVFTLKNNDFDPSADRPPNFLFNLRPEQSRSLAWMIRKEREDAEPFIEEEVEEASISQIGWRAEGRARKPVLIRGGVLADQVGYGKTVTTLALIDVQRSRDHEAANIPIEGRIPLKATLILVPPQLPDQWDREIKKFLNKKSAYNVLVIKTIVALRKTTINQFTSADIIIVSWKVCEGDPYLFHVAQFAGVIELPKTRTKRATAVWYEHALNHVCENVRELKSGGKSLQAIIDRKLDDCKRKASSEEFYVPSKRLRGQAYQRAMKSQATGTKRAHAVAFSDGDTTSENDFLRVDDGVQAEALNRREDVFGLRLIATGKKYWTSMTCPLLELFEFNRIVIDEYTYITGQDSMTIQKLKAKSRWILSATPPLRDFADVKCISKFLGINLGIDDLTPGVTKAANIRALEKDRTESEQFQSFKISQSAAWHENRQQIAQRFLDQFVRQNIADLDAIQGSTHLMPIILPAAERAIYLELNQLLASNDFNMKNSKLISDNDRARRIQEILGSSKSAGEALMKCASHFTLIDHHKSFKNAPEACDVIVKVRQEQYNALKDDFRRKLKQAEWLKNQCSDVVEQYSRWKGHIKNNQFGDSGVMKEILSIVAVAETGYKKDDWTEFYMTAEQKANIDNSASTVNAKRKIAKGKKMIKRKKAAETSEFEESYTSEEEVTTKPVKSDNRRIRPVGFNTQRKMDNTAIALRDVTNDLRKLSTELVNRRRCLRFFECAREMQRLCSSSGRTVSVNKFSCSKCGTTDSDLKEVSILSQCGHAICDLCFGPYEKRQDDCLIPGCDAVNKDYQIIKAPELGVEDDQNRVGQHYGRKLEEIVRLIKEIPKDDQVLLFIQFVDLLKTITSALKANGVTYSALAESGDASEKLTEFQTNLDSATKKKVLILNIGDSSAAGSNLTNANHVLFVSPYLTESQQTYDQAMTQAIGRARRYGQTKPVHIYKFLSLKTIDVDTLQLRSGKVLAENVAPLPKFLPFNTFTHSSFGLANALHGESGEFGSVETSKLLVENDDE